MVFVSFFCSCSCFRVVFLRAVVFCVLYFLFSCLVYNYSYIYIVLLFCTYCLCFMHTYYRYICCAFFVFQRIIFYFLGIFSTCGGGSRPSHAGVRGWEGG